MSFDATRGIEGQRLASFDEQFAECAPKDGE